MRKNFFQKGFTLLELLIVILIIGILTSVVVMSSIKGAAQARDVRRAQELYQIAHALQLYYSAYNQYPPNTDTDPDLGCWAEWDGGNLANGENDPFLQPLIDKGFLSTVPKEWRDIKDGWGTQCTYRYTRVVNPCDGQCPGTYAILYGACESSKCPTGERPACCEGSSWGEGGGENDPRDIAIFLKE